ncbi:MAG: DUF4402 domain-containing protein [Lentimicrobiaceae bacterium]|jgi:hypothetical protein
MKNITKLFAIALVVLGSAATSFAQVHATANASANIITPIAINKTVDLNFGNISVSNTGGTVILDPSLAGTRTATGGVTLPAVTGVFTAAKFVVTGLGTSTYSISLPAASISLSDGASHTMSVGTYTSTPSSTGVLTAGTQDIYVGATLTVAGLQAAGLYTNTTDLTVTVNYN